MIYTITTVARYACCIVTCVLFPRKSSKRTLLQYNTQYNTLFHLAVNLPNAPVYITMESRCLEPPMELKIGSRNQGENVVFD